MLNPFVLVRIVMTRRKVLWSSFSPLPTLESSPVRRTKNTLPPRIRNQNPIYFQDRLLHFVGRPVVEDSVTKSGCHASIFERRSASIDPCATPGGVSNWRRLAGMLQSGQRDVEAESLEAHLHGQFAVPARTHPNLEESRRRFFQQAPARHENANDIVIGIQRAESWLLMEVIRLRDGVEKSRRILRSLPSSQAILSIPLRAKRGHLAGSASSRRPIRTPPPIKLATSTTKISSQPQCCRG